MVASVFFSQIARLDIHRIGYAEGWQSIIRVGALNSLGLTHDYQTMRWCGPRELAHNNSRRQCSVCNCADGTLVHAGVIKLPVDDSLTSDANLRIPHQPNQVNHYSLMVRGKTT